MSGIQRWQICGEDGYMDEWENHGDYVLYNDHKAIVENLKKTHEQELRNARERGYSDGQDSNYSWRV